MIVQRVPFHRLKATAHVQAMLMTLGLPRKKVHHAEKRYGKKRYRSFWDRSDNELMDILLAAKEGYSRLIRRHHPDCRDGSLVIAQELNLIWKRVQSIFRRRKITLE